jgi:hypothetical protein
MTEYEEKSLFLNEVAFLAMFICKPKSNKDGLYEPFYTRFLKVQKYVRSLYIKLLISDFLPNH